MTRLRYGYLDPRLIQTILQGLALRQLFNQLLLAAGGDVEEVLRWLKELQKEGYIDPSIDLEAFLASLLEEGYLQPSPQGGLELGIKGIKEIRKGALEEIFQGLKKSGVGEHAVPKEGGEGELLTENRPYRFGDPLEHLDFTASLKNTLIRTVGDLAMKEEDLVVREKEKGVSCATVIALDISHSMVLYGEDRITPGKKVALALQELIQKKYPKDSLDLIVFGDEARWVPLRKIPFIQAGPYYTNTAHALQVARQILLRRKSPNRQIFLITDGKPSAIFHHGGLYRNAWGLDLRIINKTLQEGELCRKKGVVISTFMLATDRPLRDFVEKLTQINRGRAFYASPYHLGSFVLSDYIRNRKKTIH